MNKAYKLIIQEPVAMIELPDRSFEAFNMAMAELVKTCGDQRIFFMQSIDKEGDVFKVLIVFNFP